MNTSDFIRRFLNGTLGRKTTHSSYYVREFPSCHVLMFRDSRGSARVALVKMSDNVLLANPDVPAARDAAGMLHGNGWSVITATDFKSLGFTDVTELGVLDSRVVYRSDDPIKRIVVALLACGNKRFLLDTIPGADGKVVNAIDYINSEHVTTHLGMLVELPEGSANTVSQARRQLVPWPDDADLPNIFAFCGGWLITPKEKISDPVIDHESLRFPHPLTFNIPIDLISTDEYKGGFVVKPEVVKRVMAGELNKYLQPEVIASVVAYSEARDNYDKLTAEAGLSASGEFLKDRFIQPVTIRSCPVAQARMQTLEHEKVYIKGRIVLNRERYYYGRDTSSFWIRATNPAYAKDTLQHYTHGRDLPDWTEVLGHRGTLKQGEIPL